MKKIIISGSSKLQAEVNFWVQHFKEKEYEVIDYPKKIPEDEFEKNYPKVLKAFYQNLEKTDVYFLMNEKKNGIEGYIGAGSLAELAYVIIQNLIHNKNIKIYILNMPSQEVNSYDEVKFWLDMGWIELYNF